MGVVPYILNNRYNDINHMLSETSFFYEIVGMEGNIFWNKLKDKGVDFLKAICLPLAGMVDGITPAFLGFDATGRVDVLLEKLKQIPEMEQILRTVFRKSMSVMSYYQSRQKKLEYQLASQILNTTNQGAIKDKLDDEERYNQHIKPEVDKFRSKKIVSTQADYSSVEYMKQHNIYDGEKDPFLEEAMQAIDKRKNDLLEIDDEDDDESVIFDIKKELKEGKLTPKGKEKLQKLCEEFEEEIDGFGRQAWYNRMMPFLSMFDFEGSDTMNRILRAGDYDEVVKVYKDALQDILKKSIEGTLTESALDDFQEKIEDYYKFQKSLTVSSMNLTETRDEHGNVIVQRTS